MGTLSQRITDQLMYLNQRKEENESSSEQRKTILMWNGLVSWGGVETGQRSFSNKIAQSTGTLMIERFVWLLLPEETNDNFMKLFYLSKLLNHKLLVVRL